MPLSTNDGVELYGPSAYENVLIARMGLVIALHQDLHYRDAVSELRKLEERLCDDSGTRLYHKDVWASASRVEPLLQRLVLETSLIETSLYRELRVFFLRCDNQREAARKKVLEVLEDGV